MLNFFWLFWASIILISVTSIAYKRRCIVFIPKNKHSLKIPGHFRIFSKNVEIPGLSRTKLNRQKLNSRIFQECGHHRVQVPFSVAVLVSEAKNQCYWLTEGYLITYFLPWNRIYWLEATTDIQGHFKGFTHAKKSFFIYLIYRKLHYSLYLYTSLRLNFQVYSSLFSVRIKARRYSECLVDSLWKTWKLEWLYLLIIFGKKYFAVLFNEWDTFDILNEQKFFFCILL